jgi:RNA polymerase sigma factor (sigma-70 family)
VSQAPQTSLPASFEDVWRALKVQVYAYCLRTMGDPALAEELTQLVAIRVWRGLRSFRGECPLVTWVMTITKREIAREISRRMKERASKKSLEHTHEQIAATTQPTARETPELTSIIQNALQSGVLGEMEAKIIQTRLLKAQLGTSALADELGLSVPNYATISCRAIPKLRAFMFLHYPGVFGGIAEIHAAFQAAVTTEVLTRQEAAVFKSVVLDKKQFVKVTTVLISACAKVVRGLAQSTGGML